jgi:transposase-like protein
MPRRSYTRAQKAALVGEAEVKGVRRTAREHHIPVSTLQAFRTHPDYAQMRTEKREDVAADVWTAFQMGVQRVMQLIPDSDDLQKVATATGIIYDKYALIAGQATSRSEHRDIVSDLDDHERDTLARILREAVEEEADAGD